MESIKLVNILNDLSQSLTSEINALEGQGVKCAKTEAEYKKTLRVEALKLKSQDMAVTLIDKVVYGVDEVAMKRLERDIAESKYKAMQERINGIKLQMRILENQIEREWGRHE